MTETADRCFQVVIITNESPDWTDQDRFYSNAMIDLLSNGLQAAGHTVRLHRFFDDLSFLDAYSPGEWLVWNWGEDLAGQPGSEWRVAAELERRGFTYTGADADCLRLLADRGRVKDVLRAHGVPTLPNGLFHTPEESAGWTDFPAIVKAANLHASTGIDRHAVVSDPDSLARRVAYLREHFHDSALVEPFLESREFQVAVWGNTAPEALPPAELVFEGFDHPHERIYMWEWKFNRDSRGYQQVRVDCPAPLDQPDWEPRLRAVAVAAYRALGLRDYARFDLRLRGDDPQVLDANANPDMDFVSVLPLSSRVLGLDYGQMGDRIVRLAAERFLDHRRNS